MRVCTKCGLEKPEEEFPSSGGNQCRECRIQYLREYRVKNRDRLIQFDKDRYSANPEFKRDLARKWAKENRERHNANTREWARRNPEKDRAATRKWAQNNPDKARAKQHRRRMAVKGGGPVFSADEWTELKAKYGHRCLCCGKTEPDIALTADHIVPLSRGGTSAISNIQPLCKSCNARKFTKTIDYRNVEN